MRPPDAERRPAPQPDGDQHSSDLAGGEISSQHIAAHRNGSALHIPADMPDHVLGAALAYSRAGWFVGPVRPGTKNPGSVLGAAWPERTSRDSELIEKWFIGTPDGVYLHAGRSGSVIFDVDDADELPDDLRAELQNTSVPFQRTRDGDPLRGHYLFACPPGRRIGNSTKGFAGEWGEIRGQNGVIVVAPTQHPAGGHYSWARTGPLPVVPPWMAERLADADQRASGSVPELLVALPMADQPECHRMTWKADRLVKAIPLAGSRHNTTLPGVLDLVRFGTEHPGAGSALARVREAFLAAVMAGENIRSAPTAQHEWQEQLNGALGLVQDATRWTEDMCILPCDPPWHPGDPPRARTPGGDAGRATTGTVGPPGAAENEFWDSRPELAHIRDFARSRVVSPWAVFGCLLARTLTTVPPNVVLPPIVGTIASLNTFAGLVGASGVGKGGAEGAAIDAVPLGMDVHTTSPGSGEGLVHQYRKWTKEDPQAIIRDRALFIASEVDTLIALGGRRGATLLSQMRAAWSGESLGHGFVDQMKAVILPRHSYRLCLIVGIQPGRAGPLLNDADGGTPQRILWMPGTDPAAPDIPPEEPGPRPLPDQEWQKLVGRQLVLAVPADVRAEIRAAQLRNVRGRGVDRYSGHLRLSRLKVAQGLTFLAGRRTMTVDDWELAGIVIDMSEGTRRAVMAFLESRGVNDAERLGKHDGIRSAAAEDVVRSSAVTRVARLLMRKIPAASISQNDLKKAMAGRDREYFAEAVDALVIGGQVVRIEADGGVRFRLTQPTES